MSNLCIPSECPKHKVIEVRIRKIKKAETDSTKGAIKIVTNRCVKNQMDLIGFHFTVPRKALVSSFALTLSVSSMAILRLLILK
ncbi:hypothetical protein GCM10009114_12330 [Aliiglaciecola litoralis]|uniref:Transposase DDE domain-containing protein n=1 Tax=Aliiglaciecola litoralis TaxID=582857 RepID=A0ABP3WQW2_9ALTE